MESKAKIIVPIVMGVGFVACVAVSYFSSSLNAFDKYEIVTVENAVENTQPADESTSTDSQEVESNVSVDPAKTREHAVEYLKGKIWERSEMETYPDLKGLWDDLNNFNFNTIASKWAEILKDAGRQHLVEEVYMAITNCKGILDSPYAENGSTKITYIPYLSYVSNVRQGKTAVKESNQKAAGNNNNGNQEDKNEKSSTNTDQDAIM